MTLLRSFVSLLLEQDLEGRDLSLNEAVDLACARLRVPRQVAIRLYFMSKDAQLCRVWAVAKPEPSDVVVSLSNRGLEFLAANAKVTCSV
jgi:hypothetical protein